MAGEFEEPLSISFQTDSLHSGSISFGRFESEELSWERRSSFSHNRYLEEVEKYSRPGSVTEKKAYFEAHFKKKGIRLPGFFGSQVGGEYRSDTDVFEYVDHKDEDDMNGSSNYDQFDEGVLDIEYTEFEDQYEASTFDYANHSSSQYAHLDESPESSEYRGECEVMEYEREDTGVLSSDAQTEGAAANADVLVEGFLESIKPLEGHENDTRYENVDTPEIGTNENLNDSAANANESYRPIDPSPKSGGAVGIDKTTAVNQHTLSPKLGDAAESKHVKSRLKSQVNINQVRKGSSNDASKTSGKKLNKGEREIPLRLKSEKQSPQAAIPNRHVLPRTPKGLSYLEDSESCNSRSSLANKSEKEPNPNKGNESQPSGSRKVEPRVRQNTNRFKQTGSAAKPDTRTSTAAFSFKSDERAERRKQFYMKLEEKIHAKEAEMNQIQARTQEKTEAEIKQFRKSLNFKATPMPSFYHTAGSPRSNGNKATSFKTKPAKIQQKSTSPGSGTATRSKLLSKAGATGAVSAGEPMKTTSVPESLVKTDCHAIETSEAGETLSLNNKSHLEAVIKNSVNSKESKKVKDTNGQRHRVSENGKMSKDQKAEGKPKMGNRSSSQMVRKSIKGVGIGSNSGMGRVAVGVAS